MKGQIKPLKPLGPQAFWRGAAHEVIERIPGGTWSVRLVARDRYSMEMQVGPERICVVDDFGDLVHVGWGRVPECR